MYQMSHIPVLPFEAVGMDSAFEGLKTNSAEENPFTIEKEGAFGTVLANPFKVSEPSNLRALLFGSEGFIRYRFMLFPLVAMMDLPHYIPLFVTPFHITFYHICCYRRINEIGIKHMQYPIMPPNTSSKDQHLCLCPLA